MSTAVSEPCIEWNRAQQNHIQRPVQLELVTAAQAQLRPEAFADPHPLLPVFFAGAFALLLAGTLVGSIVVWLLLRNSGVMQ